MNKTYLLSLTGGAALGVFSAYVYNKIISNRTTEIVELDDSNPSPLRIPKPSYKYTPDYKVVVGVRTDMKLSLSETAGLLGDVVIKTVVNSIKSRSKYVSPWLHTGQTKICAKVQSKEMMDDLIQKAIDAHLIHETIEFKNQKAAFVAGPAPIEVVDLVTRHLKLL
ncbi:hypothetical protein TRFO_40427 [Tritrichomonas foetus]|uniref:peptidyl-tRNA hydrolase n=1 Tax=Tritrichomonas foetus TaxID=1144522 RepID=A0A1J4J741_9EUKA|nr:hypothetical protein TRFO_40427 [Tritrichomonas foetus]|eukprot:OHS93253.1 hypothetical protein TRFO_40427 [Tritrichomonas foetus]